MLTRPTAAQVRAYRAHVDEALDRLFDRDVPSEAQEFVELGINHEQQHQELLLTDILSLFSSGPLMPAYRDAKPDIPKGNPGPLTWSSFDGGIF